MMRVDQIWSRRERKVGNILMGSEVAMTMMVTCDRGEGRREKTAMDG